MYAKQLFTNGRVWLAYIVTLACIYVLCILTCTVGFFTPHWLVTVARPTRWYLNYLDNTECDSVGLISGSCRFPFSHGEAETTAFAIKRTFYCVLLTMCILYASLVMTILLFAFSLFDSRVFMEVLSIIYGLFYPIGAISVLYASIKLEVDFTSDVGFSTILATISGGLMTTFYIGLRFYDYQYSNWSLKLQAGNNKTIHSGK